MVTNEQITIYRIKVSQLLQLLRNALFVESGRTVFPTDSSIAFMLGISPTALSSISRQCSSMSGLTLHRLFSELASRVDKSHFACIVSDFAS